MLLSSDVSKNYDTEGVKTVKNETVSSFEMANSCSNSDVAFLPENSHTMLDSSRQDVLIYQTARARESGNNSILAEHFVHCHSEELPLAVEVSEVFVDGPNSSSSTDSAESVRNLSSGTKVDILDADSCHGELNELHASGHDPCLVSSNAPSHSSCASTKLCFGNLPDASLLFAQSSSAMATACTSSQHPFSLAAGVLTTTSLVTKKNLASVVDTGYRFSDAGQRLPSTVCQQQWSPGVARSESNSQMMVKHPVNGLIDSKTAPIQLAKPYMETHLPLEHAYAQIPEPGKFQQVNSIPG